MGFSGDTTKEKSLNYLSKLLFLFGTPGRIRTCDLRIRRRIFGSIISASYSTVKGLDLMDCNKS